MSRKLIFVALLVIQTASGVAQTTVPKSFSPCLIEFSAEGYTGGLAEARLVLYNADQTFVEINDYFYPPSPFVGPVFGAPGPILEPSGTGPTISGTYSYTIDPADPSHFILIYYGANKTIIGGDDLYFQSLTSGSAFLPPEGGASLNHSFVTFELSPLQNTNGGSNVSTRCQLANGATAISGFVIQSSGPRWVVVRAVGSTLANFGVTNTVSNPSITLFDSSNAYLAKSSIWSSDPNLVSGFQTIFSLVGAFPLKGGSDEGVILYQLQPGAYTAVFQASTQGQILLEAYILPF